MEETWKDIKGYEGFYQVSSLGRVRSLDRIVKHSEGFEKIAYGRIIKQHKDGGGYYQVGLHKYGKMRRIHVHRLVAETFIINEFNKREVNHIDENKENNSISNLEWVTRIENEHHGTKNKRRIEHTNYKEIANKNKKKLLQIDLQGNVVKEWNGLAEVHEILGYSAGNISRACNGKYIKPLYGYYWRYI